MLRRTLAVTGKILMAAGILLALFVAYQLWGTGLAESHSQKALGHQFQSERAKTGTAASTSTTPPSPVLPGYAVALIQIPKIGVQKYVVEGTAESDLQKGPGHYPGTPLPGQPGNVAIAGHRTTYGAPFYNLDQLKPGDPIRLTTTDGMTYTYDVTGSQVVAPTDVGVVGPTRDNRLTLTTCNPRFSAATRLIVSALLQGTPTPVAVPTSASGAPAPESAPQNLTAGQSRAIPAIVLYGLLDLGVWLAAWALSRRLRWGAWVLGLPLFLVVLFFFFENVSRILPASV